MSSKINELTIDIYRSTGYIPTVKLSKRRSESVMNINLKAKWLKPLVVTLTAYLSTPVTVMAAGDITFRKINSYFKLKGVDGGFTPEKVLKIQSLFQVIRTQLTDQSVSFEEPEHLFIAKKLSKCSQWLPLEFCKSVIKDKRESQIDVSDFDDILPFIDYGLNLTNQALQSQDSSDLAWSFLMAKNILYSIFSVSYEGRPMKIDEILKIPFTRMVTWTPRLSEKKKNKPAGIKKAKKESSFLVNPFGSDPGHFLTHQELAQLTPLQIADLDVRPDHHIWYDRETFKYITSPWSYLESKVMNQIAESTSDVSYINSGNYFHDARKIVIFDRFKNKKGGTHGKIRVKDPNGMKWKLKWGDEFFTEALANRLYVSLGGKHQDLNYAHTAQNPVFMIFPDDPTKERLGDTACEAISDFPSLNLCLQQSRYKLNLSPYLHVNGYGVLRDQDVEWIANKLHLNQEEAISQLSPYIGRNYVFFQETSLEFKDKAGLKRSGPMSQSLLGSENDRAMRGMLLFHFFTDNFDAKDANGESLIINHHGKPEFLQAPVDLGAAFRGFAFKGRGLNHLETKSFLRKSHFSSGKLVYTHPMPYRTKAGEKATYADMLWMAKKIASLSEEAIIDAVRHTHMPEFYQKTLIYKLIKRRNRIAKLYQLESMTDIKDSQLRLPEITLDLSSEDKISSLATDLGIPVEIFYKEMRHAGIQPGTQFHDQVVKKGKIRKCYKSFVVNLLEKYAYPTGLSRSPSKSKENPGVCQYKP